MKKSLFLCLLGAITCSPMLPCSAEETNHWPAFLGAGAMRAKDAKLPLRWSPTEHIAWTGSLRGHGQSSPIVFGNHVYVTSVNGKMKDDYCLSCLDLQTGETQWERVTKNIAPVENSVYVSRSAPTPLADAERVIALYESGSLIAISHDGQPLWERNLNQDYGPIKAQFGIGASPCQNDSHVFVLLEHENPGYLLAINKKSGETDWKVERPAKASWSSPAIIKSHNTEHVVVSSAGSVVGYDAKSGKLLWSINDLGGNTGVTPMDNGSGTFLIGASGGRQGENELAAKKSNGLVRIEKSGDAWTASVAWANDKLSVSWASPILHEGLAYWVNRTGVVFCVDAATGDLVYSERTKQSCWATPIAIGNRIYLFGKDGLTTVIAAGKKFEILAENQLFDPEKLPPEPTPMADESTEQRRQAAANFSGPTLYGAALAGESIVVRIGHVVYCIR